MDPFDLDDGFVPAVVELTGVQELERVLSHWVNSSDRPTVGATGARARGGAPAIAVALRRDRFVVNRDTTRSAVREFLAAAARAGGAPNLPWQVTYNRDGRLNRVTYRTDHGAAAGWYAYLVAPAGEPRPLT